MEWIVTVRLADLEGQFPVEATTSYSAKAKALSRFLREYGIPGRPYEFLSGEKRHLVELNCKSEEDRRTIPRVSY